MFRLYRALYRKDSADMYVGMIDFIINFEGSTIASSGLAISSAMHMQSSAFIASIVSLQLRRQSPTSAIIPLFSSLSLSKFRV